MGFNNNDNAMINFLEWSSVKASYYNGTSWSSNSTISGSDTPGNVVNAMNDNDQVMCLWHITASKTLRYARYSGGSWGAPATIATESINPQYYAIGMNGSGDAIAIWNTGTVKSRYYTASTSSWSDTITVDTGVYNGPVHIYMNSSGNALAVWQNSSNYLVGAFYNKATNSWSKNTVSNATSSILSDEYRKQVSMNDFNSGVVAWRNSFPGTVLVAEHLLKQWSDPIELDDSITDDPRAFINNSQYMSAVWQNADASKYVYSSFNESSPFVFFPNFNKYIACKYFNK